MVRQIAIEMRLGNKANKEQIEHYKMGTQDLDFLDMESTSWSPHR